MNEYIITEKQLKTACLKREIPLPFIEVYVSGDKLPEIVRCRDCKHMQRDTDYCFCMLAARELESVDGFCAWGERRDSGRCQR